MASGVHFGYNGYVYEKCFSVPFLQEESLKGFTLNREEG